MGGYPVPAGEARVELRFKNSRFIGVAAPAASVAAAKEVVARLRAEFADASHHVYAFAVGFGASVVHGMSDDGEPSGTAGRPTLAVVRGAGLGDVAVVTVRYFGGSKLGTGGLVKAYTETAQEALAAVPRQQKIQSVAAHLVLPYPLYESCRSLIEAAGATIEAEDFGSQIDLRLRVEAAAAADLARQITERTAGQVRLTLID